MTDACHLVHYVAGSSSERAYVNDFIRQLILSNHGEDAGPMTERTRSADGEDFGIAGFILAGWLRDRANGSNKGPLKLGAASEREMRALLSGVAGMKELFLMIDGGLLDFRPEVSIESQREIKAFALNYPPSKYLFWG